MKTIRKEHRHDVLVGLEAGSKAAKAQELGVKMIAEDELEALL